MATTLKRISGELAKLVEDGSKALYYVYTESAPGRTGALVTTRELVSVAMQAKLGEKVTVRDKEGSERNAEVVGFDETSGVVLLRLDKESGADPFEFDSGLPQVGSLAATVALPSTQSVEARLEMVRCVGGPLRLAAGRLLEHYVQTDGVSYPGFLGAPLLSPDGKLTALALPSGGRGDNLMIPAGELAALIETLRERKRLGVAYLGVRGQSAPLSEEVASTERSAALLITQVEQESPAAGAGVRVGDFLTSVDGRPVDSIDTLLAALIGAVERKVAITVFRSGSEETLEAGLTERPSRSRSHHGGHGRHGHGGGHSRRRDRHGADGHGGGYSRG